MSSITLTNFFNPQGNLDDEIEGLTPPNTTYPLTLDLSNSYTYVYTFNPLYQLVYNSGTTELKIYDNGIHIVTYSLDLPTGNYVCTHNALNRPSVLATYFTTTIPPVLSQPYIYIRPAVDANSIRYNWEVSTLGATDFILTCASTDGGSGGGTVVLGSTINTHTFSGLSFGKTYAAGLVGTVGGSPSPSSIYRTVTTGNDPGVVQNVSYISTATTISLTWAPPAGSQTPSVGWYVVKDSNANRDYCTGFAFSSITIPFDETPHTYDLYSVSDAGYSSTIQLFV